MDQGERIGVRERRGAGRQGIECGAQGIEIGTVIDRSIHASGPLRGQIGRRAAKMTRVTELRVFLGKGRGQIEADDL